MSYDNLMMDSKANSSAPVFVAKLDKVPVVIDMNAAKAVQKLLRAASVSVDLLGQSQLRDRGCLMLVAGQALGKGVQGFGFEGVQGKYQVPLRLSEIVDLHRDAAQMVATQSARAGLSAWAAGEKVSDLSKWVPDSVQRLLYGSVSLASATNVIQAIKGGGIDRHAGEIGVHGITGLLAEQGLDANALTSEEQVNRLGLSVQEPDRNRGTYFGPVVALDHRAAMIKFTRTTVVELPFVALAKDQAKPEMKDKVRMKFNAGKLDVDVADRSLVRDGSIGR